MTFKEIPKTIEGMLAVGRNLQSADLRLQSRQERIVEAVSNLLELSEQQQRRIAQLIGYSIADESRRLNYPRGAGFSIRAQRLEYLYFFCSSSAKVFLDHCFVRKGLAWKYHAADCAIY